MKATVRAGGAGMALFGLTLVARKRPQPKPGGVARPFPVAGFITTTCDVLDVGKLLATGPLTRPAGAWSRTASHPSSNPDQ